ncbi:hypothetical protein IW261DRAFT_1498049 [Armillaria novae-zelandiae]|uniref:Uncharacterized protein n=1 Tax=Armillaria novae-zelandiae TaxID=153914 RepID=A0AA39P0L0_9AGAR|nr:hypothetical protein IW261DRAFT_1498049 [Armillaria novae-zelandiae]
MSSPPIPSRGRCIQATDSVHQCQCPSFASPLLDPNICINCRHGIHAHADYVSMVVHHYPPTQCIAYVQKTPLTQRCTCEIWLCDHLPTNNSHHSAEPWAVLDQYLDNNGPPYSPATIGISNGTTDDPYTPSSMSFSPSRDANFTPTTTPPIFSPSPRAFISFSEVDSISLAPTSLSSPSASSASPGVQSDITQAQAYSPEDYVIQYPDPVMYTSYDRQPEGGATHGNFDYHGHSNMTYGPTPEAWSGRYT